MGSALHWIFQMTNKSKKFHSLSRKIITLLCIFTLILSAIYGLLSFLLLYTIEDSFIEQQISQDAKQLKSEFEETGIWPIDRYNYLKVHFTKDSFPEDLKQQSMDQSNRSEFYGSDGRHYHLFQYEEHEDVFLVAEVSQKLMVRPIRNYVLKLFLYSGMTLTLIACLIAWLLGRKTTNPLRKLAELVDGVAPESIPHSFADEYPNNEIGILARTFEQSMRQINMALEREKCFTRDVSHELRTPIAIVKNSIELYRKKYPINNDSNQLINRMADATIQMEQTVTTLLVLAREEHTRAEKITVELLVLIEQAIIDHNYLLENKTVEVIVDEQCAVSIVAQQGMLKVLLDNLLSNAFQYTDIGEVKINYVDSKLIIENSGASIEKSIISKVTEPAIKGSQSTGYGFGLSIVKRLCEHQNWDLHVSSLKGTTTVSVSFK